MGLIGFLSKYCAYYLVVSLRRSDFLCIIIIPPWLYPLPVNPSSARGILSCCKIGAVIAELWCSDRRFLRETVAQRRWIILSLKVVFESEVDGMHARAFSPKSRTSNVPPSYPPAMLEFSSVEFSQWVAAGQTPDFGLPWCWSDFILESAIFLLGLEVEGIAKLTGF